MIQEHLNVITGKSIYIDDINPNGTVFLHVVRSPIARGIIKRISKPRYSILTLTWDEIKTYMPVRPFPKLPDQIAKMPILANGKVNFVGQPVIAIITESKYNTEDISEEVSIEYEELKPVIDLEEAMNSEPIHGELKSNLAVNQVIEGGNLSLREKAEVIVRRKIKQDRVISNPMETKGCIAWWEGGLLNLYVSTQAPFWVKNDLREILGIPPENINVSSPPNVGGGFGNKTSIIPEYVLAAIASLKLGKPVKWIETRSEMIVNTLSPGRGQMSDLELYANKSGEILGISGKIVSNIGAYTVGINFNNPIFISTLLNGPYKMKFISIKAMGVLTNTTPMGAYRGAGRPEAALLHETLVEDLSRELGIDPVEIRRRNLIGDEGHITPLGTKLDPAGYKEVFENATRYYKRAKEIHKGKGISIVVFSELVRVSPGEAVKVKIKDGKINFYLGLGPHGQAYTTTFKRIASEMLGVSEDKVEVITGSTEYVKEGIGSFGSRAGSVGSSAIIFAIKELLAKINKSKINDLNAYDGFEIETFYRANDVFAPGAHVSVVDVDNETGLVKIMEYYATDDVGRILNREEIEGQIVGGVLQGASQVIIESMKYDERGNPLCASISDCGVPTASEAPTRVISELVERPSELLSGSRGVGEAGTTGALAAVFIAIENATKKKFGRIPIEPWNIIS